MAIFQPEANSKNWSIGYKLIALFLRILAVSFFFALPVNLSKNFFWICVHLKKLVDIGTRNCPEISKMKTKKRRESLHGLLSRIKLRSLWERGKRERERERERERGREREREREQWRESHCQKGPLNVVNAYIVTLRTSNKCLFFPENAFHLLCVRSSSYVHWRTT